MTRTIHVGLEGFTFPDLDPFALVNLAAEACYTHVGIRLVNPATNSPVLTTGDALRLRAHAREREITLQGADIVDLEGPSQTWEECFSILAAAGMTRLSSFYRGTDLKAAGTRFREFVARGRDQQVTPHLEPVSYFGVRSIATAAELVANAGGGGITLDTLHFGRIGDELALLADLAQTIPIWLQVCDGPPLEELVPAGADLEERIGIMRYESIARRLPPGEGVCRVADVVRTVRECSRLPELVLMVEAPDHERARDLGSLAYASLCRDAADEVIARSTPTEDT